MRSSLSRILSAIVLAGALGLVGSSSAAAQSSDDALLRRARAVGARLTAPCCWSETLAVHDSPLARELRAEIESRLGAGDSPAEIEDDLVARYGERLRGVPPALEELSVGLVGALLLAAGALVLVGRRWVVQGRASAARAFESPEGEADAPVDQDEDAALDRRLEEALEQQTDP